MSYDPISSRIKGVCKWLGVIAHPGFKLQQAADVSAMLRTGLAQATKIKLL